MAPKSTVSSYPPYSQLGSFTHMHIHMYVHTHTHTHTPTSLTILSLRSHVFPDKTLFLPTLIILFYELKATKEI